MLSVIIETGAQPEGLPGLLAQLTAGAVEGLVRQVLIVGPLDGSQIPDLCEETGAEPCSSLREAAATARADLLMVLPASFRLRDGWLGSLSNHVRRGGEAALVLGLKAPGLFRGRPSGVLVERRRLANGGEADLKRLRRELGWGAVRIG
jgi:hypothetical protein